MSRFLSCLFLALLAGLPARLAGDVDWKAADEGPRTAVVTQILGDDTRTIAFTAEGEAEFDGAAWRPVSLNTAALPLTQRALSFRGGRFVATATEDGKFVIFALRGTSWVRIASIPWTAPWPAPWGYGPGTFGTDRYYVPANGFNTLLCDPAAVCSPGSSARRLVSISLDDGSYREEARLPSCSGTLFSVSGRLYLIESPTICGGPSRPAGAQPAEEQSYPFYRLDGDAWTPLEPWSPGASPPGTSPRRRARSGRSVRPTLLTAVSRPGS